MMVPLQRVDEKDLAFLSVSQDIQKTPQVEPVVFFVFIGQPTNEAISADNGTRTRNLLITNQLLYQLSYTGEK